MVIHILRAGLTLCGFSREVPRDWPEGHKWVAESDEPLATCVSCKDTLSKEREKEKRGS